MKRIIAFGHRKKTGKDTLAKFIVTELRSLDSFRGIRIERRGFADKLKDIAYTIYGWAGLKRREYYEENSLMKDIILPVLGRTPRDIWIQVGNRLREQDEDIWVNLVLRNDVPNIMFVTDLRFPNEINKIRQHGGVVIKVTKPDAPIDNDGADDPLANFNDWDHVVRNDGDLNSLYDCGKFIIQKYLEG